MYWDLYLDESGSFEKEGEHTLIGGVLLPRTDGDNTRLLTEWEKDIRSRISESGVYTLEDIHNGNSMHALNMLKKRKKLRPEQEEEYNRLRESRYYIFGHCSENRRDSDRWKAQHWVLSQYIAKLKAVGGATVIFDNPKGVYRIDSNATFMTIFASGLIRLYSDLKKKNPHEEIVLSVHAASRVNITRKNEPEKHIVSPVAGNQNVLEKELYINQIRNCVFLNGGHDLLELDAFNRSLDSFEILNDVEATKGTAPHPATVVCDYVCNSMFVSRGHREFKEFFSGKSAYCYNVFDGALSSTDFSEDLYAQKHDWGWHLKNLVSLNFPENRTADFFERMKKDRRFDQVLCVQSLNDYLYSFVDNRENMHEWIERIQMIIKHCTPMEEEAYAILKANMLLYLNTLYTHLGQLDDVQATVQDIILSAAKIKEITHRDELFVKFLNRQIVTHTDLFQLDKAAKFFHVLEEYLDKRLQCSEDLLLEYAVNTDQETIPDTICEQYGRCIGSYIQVLTKMLRNANKDDREKLQRESNEIAAKAFRHFWKGKDVSRAHQNLCGLYVETGEYERALKELCQALSVSTEGGFEEQADAFLEVVGHYGERNTFGYYHYVYLMHRCIRTNDKHGSILLNCILKETPNAEKLASLKQVRYPQSVIMWHLAASLVTQSKYRPRAKELFDASKQALSTLQGESTFRTIAIAVACEEIACGLEGLLPGKPEKWEKEAARFLKEVYPAYAARNSVNPFTGLIPNERDARLSAREYYDIADAIAY